MGFSIGAVILDVGSTDVVSLLAKVRPAEYTPVGGISPADATDGSFNGTAAAAIDGAVLILSAFLPYDCGFSPDDLSGLDERLAAISKDGSVLALIIDEVSMTFAFSYFERGELRRVRQVDPGSIYADFGDPLSPEADFDAASHDDSQRIFALSERILGVRLDELIADDDVELTVYEADAV